MSSFKDAVQEDLNSVFLNLDEFAETHTVYYDGEEYSDIPIVMTGLSEKERVRQSISDHAVLQPSAGSSRSRAANWALTKTDLSAATMWHPLPAKWGCCGWNWRRLTNE